MNCRGRQLDTGFDLEESYSDSLSSIVTGGHHACRRAIVAEFDLKIGPMIHVGRRVTGTGLVRRFLKRVFALQGLTLVLVACAGSGPPPASIEGEYSVTVEVRALECCEGALRVALYNHAEHWLEEGHMVRGRVTPVQAETQTVGFSGLPAGQYAIAVFQDLELSGRLNRLFGIIPTEPYGFSGGKQSFRPPSFDDAAFDVPGVDEVVVELQAPFR